MQRNTNNAMQHEPSYKQLGVNISRGNRSGQHNTELRTYTHNRTTQKTKNMSNTEPTKKPGQPRSSRSVISKTFTVHACFSGVRVTRSLVLCVYFVDRCLSFCTFPFGHCVVCSSSIYGFWLPLWYRILTKSNICTCFIIVCLFSVGYWISRY
jgi:hypothetical protein